MRLCHLLSAAVLLVATSLPSVVLADVNVPPVFSDHMVLQRDLAAPVWGTAEAGEEVAVSIAGQSHHAKADAEGNWSVKLKPLKAGGPHVLGIKGTNSIELKDVLVGDVWIGSGQSNMAGGVRGYAKGDEVLAELAAGTYPQLRLCRGKGGNWQESNPQTNAGFSAILFAFGQRLQKDLDVPVGLILGAVGGTPSGRWLTDEMLASTEQTNTYKAAKGGDLYQQHILPVVPYGIRGVLVGPGGIRHSHQGPGPVYHDGRADRRLARCLGTGRVPLPVRAKAKRWRLCLGQVESYEPHGRRFRRVAGYASARQRGRLPRASRWDHAASR